MNNNSLSFSFCLCLFFILVFMFSFSVRTNIPCRLSIFFSIVLFFWFLFPTREYLFCFQFIVPSNNIHDRAGFVIEWRKHSVIGFQFIFSLCVLPAVFVHGEISWILNCIMEHAPPFHYATPSIRLSFRTKNKKKKTSTKMGCNVKKNFTAKKKSVDHEETVSSAYWTRKMAKSLIFLINFGRVLSRTLWMATQVFLS